MCVAYAHANVLLFACVFWFCSYIRPHTYFLRVACLVASYVETTLPLRAPSSVCVAISEIPHPSHRANPRKRTHRNFPFGESDASHDVTHPRETTLCSAMVTMGNRTPNGHRPSRACAQRSKWPTSRHVTERAAAQ